MSKDWSYDRIPGINDSEDDNMDISDEEEEMDPGAAPMIISESMSEANSRSNVSFQRNDGKFLESYDNQKRVSPIFDDSPKGQSPEVVAIFDDSSGEEEEKVIMIPSDTTKNDQDHIVISSDEDDESKKGKPMVKPRCTLCDALLMGPTNIKVHVEGAKHQKMLKTYEAEKKQKETLDKALFLFPIMQPAGSAKPETDFIVYEEWDGHKRKSKAKPKPEFRCDVCDVKMISEEHLKSHLGGMRHARMLVHSGKAEQGPVFTDDFDCKLCSVAMASQLEYEEHIQGQKHNTMLLLKLTGQLYTEEMGESSTSVGLTEEELEPHIQYGVTGVRQYVCKVCDITLTGKMQYEQHLKGVKHTNVLLKARYKSPTINNESFSCKLCNKVMNSQKSYEEHQKTKNHRRLLVNQGLLIEEREIKPVMYQPGKLKIQTYLDKCGSPLVGLQYMVEYQHPTNPDRNAYYECFLCDAAFGVVDAMKHLVGWKHKREYLKKHLKWKVQLHVEAGHHLLKGDMMPEVLKQAASVAHKENGQYKISVYEWDPKQEKPDVFGGNAPRFTQIHSSAIGDTQTIDGKTMFSVDARVIVDKPAMPFPPASTGVNFIQPGTTRPARPPGPEIRTVGSHQPPGAADPLPPGLVKEPLRHRTGEESFLMLLGALKNYQVSSDEEAEVTMRILDKLKNCLSHYSEKKSASQNKDEATKGMMSLMNIHTPASARKRQPPKASVPAAPQRVARPIPPRAVGRPIPPRGVARPIPPRRPAPPPVRTPPKPPALSSTAVLIKSIQQSLRETQASEQQSAPAVPTQRSLQETQASERQSYPVAPIERSLWETQAIERQSVQAAPIESEDPPELTPTQILMNSIKQTLQEAKKAEPACESSTTSTDTKGNDNPDNGSERNGSMVMPNPTELLKQSILKAIRESKEADISDRPRDYKTKLPQQRKPRMEDSVHGQTKYASNYAHAGGAKKTRRGLRPSEKKRLADERLKKAIKTKSENDFTHASFPDPFSSKAQELLDYRDEYQKEKSNLEEGSAPGLSSSQEAKQPSGGQASARTEQEKTDKQETNSTKTSFPDPFSNFWGEKQPTGGKASVEAEEEKTDEKPKAKFVDPFSRAVREEWAAKFPPNTKSKRKREAKNQGEWKPRGDYSGGAQNNKRKEQTEDEGNEESVPYRRSRSPAARQADREEYPRSVRRGSPPETHPRSKAPSRESASHPLRPSYNRSSPDSPYTRQRDRYSRSPTRSRGQTNQSDEDYERELEADRQKLRQAFAGSPSPPRRHYSHEEDDHFRPHSSRSTYRRSPSPGRRLDRDDRPRRDHGYRGRRDDYM